MKFMLATVVLFMVGCHAMPRTPSHLHGVKYEMKEEITVKEEFSADKHTLPTATASLSFGQSW